LLRWQKSGSEGVNVPQHPQPAKLWNDFSRPDVPRIVPLLKLEGAGPGRPMLFGSRAVERLKESSAATAMQIRVVPGEIAAKDATVRVALPTSAQPHFPPFQRVAETISTPRRRVAQHHHAGVEVLTHVLEGSGVYEYGTSPPDPVRAGSTRLLTAATNVSHAINPAKGGTIRYFAVLTPLPPGDATESRVQSARGVESPPQADGTAVTHLVGPDAGVRSAIGLEGESLRFVADGTSFRKVGHGHLALCYALSGRGTVDGQPIDGGEAAFIEDAAGIALQGRVGFRAIVLRVPRAANSSP
jgi:redox-sensitive bicupin YhaK (pirin superfamily)